MSLSYLISCLEMLPIMARTSSGKPGFRFCKNSFCDAFGAKERPDGFKLFNGLEISFV